MRLLIVSLSLAAGALASLGGGVTTNTASTDVPLTSSVTAYEPSPAPAPQSSSRAMPTSASLTLSISDFGDTLCAWKTTTSDFDRTAWHPTNQTPTSGEQSSVDPQERYDPG